VGIGRVARAGGGRGEPRVGGIGLGEGRLAIDRQPGIQGVVAGLGGVEMGGGEVARRDGSGSEPVGHLVGEQAREVGHDLVVIGAGAPQPPLSSLRIGGETM
jgi:hypothetical protein